MSRPRQEPRDWRALAKGAVEQRFLFAGLGVALRVLDDAGRLFFGATDRLGGNALPVGYPPSKHGTGRHHNRTATG